MTSATVADANTITSCKIVFFVLLFANLFLGAYYPALLEGSGLQLVVALLVGALALIWARADARAHGRELPAPLAVGIVMLAAVFVPAWLFLSRTQRDAGWAVARFSGWVVALIVFFSVGASALERLGIPTALAAG